MVEGVEAVLEGAARPAAGLESSITSRWFGTFRRVASPERRRGSSVRRKILAVFGCVMIGTVAVIGTTMIMRERSSLRISHMNSIRAMARQLSLHTYEALLLPSPELRLALDSLVTELMSSRELNLLGLSVVDRAGQVIVPLGASENVSYQFPSGIPAPSRVDRNLTLARYRAADGTGAIHVTSPVFHRDTLIGRIEADVSEKHISRAVLTSTLNLIGITLLVLIVGAILTGLSSSFISKPIRTLTERIHGMGFGTSSDVLSKGGESDEISELTAAFARMWHSLETSVQRIHGGVSVLTQNSGFLFSGSHGEGEIFQQRYRALYGELAGGAAPDSKTVRQVFDRLRTSVDRISELASRKGRVLKAAAVVDGQEGRLDEHVLSNVFQAMDVATEDTVSTHEMLKTILREAGESIVVTDPLGYVVFSNPLAGDLLKPTGGKGSQRNIWFQLQNRFGWSSTEVLDALQSVTAPQGHKEWRLEMEQPRRTLRMTVAGVWDHDNHLLACVFVFADLTEMAELDRRKTETLHFISHEMRSPLTVIQTYAELLQDAVADSDQGTRQSEMILDQAARLRRLIDTFLDVERLESGRQELRLDQVNLVSVIHQTIEGMQLRANEKSIRLIPELPAGIDNMTLDSDLIVQVLYNLLSNAIEYSPEGREIRMKLESQGTEVKVSVIDQGYGLSEEETARLFQKFYRASSAKHRKGKGTGLGLSFVKQVVEAHGGKVGVKSNLDEGSTFWFSLPLGVSRPA